MELTYLPDQKTTRRTYKHFTIQQNPVIEPPADNKKLEFFYIGRSTGNIDNLISAFESGYAAENTGNARSMLNRLMSNSQNITIPDIIIAEAAIGADELRAFHSFLLEHPVLAATPFIIEGSGLTETEIDRFRKFDFIDEIIYLKDYNSKQALCRKVSFLKKIKNRLVMESVARSIETSMRPPASFGSVLKRGFDILIAGALLLALSPVFLLIALAIRIESKGSVFYIAKRAGRGYKIFDFYKFRTMLVGADSRISEFSHLNQYESAEKTGPLFFKIDNDPRITKLGVFLRKTSLDELPQLVNVLLGDMSLVGNRPLPLYEAATLTTDEWAKRFMAPAGMTGLWQIKKRGRKDMSIEERITLDIDYADKYNFLYDMWIMANTPSALFQKTNA